jgi:tetratricopeptide (TPR) repeat protein
MSDTEQPYHDWDLPHHDWDRPHDDWERSTRPAWAATAIAVLLLSVQNASAQRPAAPASNEPLARARAAILHGQYAEAESLLTPLASRTSPNDAALELGLLLQQLGRKAEADRWLDAVAASSRASNTADFIRIGRAAQALGEFRVANEAFQAAAGKGPEDAAVNIAWGRLFLQTHNRAEAAKSFQIAIKSDPKSAAALHGLAEALTDDNPPAALTMAQRALELDQAYVPAHLLVAELMLDRGERDEAQKSIGRALDVNPSSLEGHALRAAMANLLGRQAEFQDEIAIIRKINPGYGEAYRVAGDHAARNYRFGEASELTKQAITIDPDNTRAYADLGIQLLRTGDEEEARASLERAFKSDPYDTVTYNLLSLLDTLDKFQTFREGDVVLRLHADEAAVLREYAMPLAQEALSTLSARYQFKPQGPILLEIFPKHDDFAVRTAGLPGMIGALGACFGRVVTMDSPRARPPGTFNWASTLWHEMTHVITLQMSRQRVPRWLTEGLSMYEERRSASTWGAGPDWGREGEVSFVQALQRGKTLPLKDLNAGFTDPELISIAYYEASLVVEHIINTFGEAALRKLVTTYGEGVEGEAALERGLGVDITKLQAGFDDMLKKMFGPLQAALQPPPDLQAAMGDPARMVEYAKAHPDSYVAQIALGNVLLKEEELDEAMAAFEKAAKLVPIAIGRDSPHAVMAAIATKQGNRDRAIAELETLLQRDDSNIEAARQLVSLLGEKADRARLTAAYEKVVAIDPFDPAAHAALGKLEFQAQDYPKAIRELRVALASGVEDRAAVHVDLAEAYLAAKQPAEAKRQTLAALEIAPAYERAQTLLLKLVEPIR